MVVTETWRKRSKEGMEAAKRSTGETWERRIIWCKQMHVDLGKTQNRGGYQVTEGRE